MGAQAVRLSNVDINNALENKDFEVLFQPIFDLSNGALARMETFVRWRHQTLGVLPPGAFISFFESQGRMGELTRYVLNVALDEYADWRGPYAPGFSINLALTDLSDEAFAPHLTKVLRDRAFPPDLVTLECPMPPIDADMDALTEQFERLRKTGARLAIEVRGRANEFLRTIDPFPFDEIKTGGSAILRFARTVRGPGLSAISDLLDIAKRSNAVITAVGVEDQPSLSALKGLGFTAAQGNHLAKVGAVSDFRPSKVNEVRGLLELSPLSGDELSALFRTEAPSLAAGGRRGPAAAVALQEEPEPEEAVGAAETDEAETQSAAADEDDAIDIDVEEVDADQDEDVDIELAAISMNDPEPDEAVDADADIADEDADASTGMDPEREALVARARKKARAIALARRARAREARKAAAIRRARERVAGHPDPSADAPAETDHADMDSENAALRAPASPIEMQGRLAKEFDPRAALAGEVEVEAPSDLGPQNVDAENEDGDVVPASEAAPATEPEGNDRDPFVEDLEDDADDAAATATDAASAEVDPWSEEAVADPVALEPDAVAPSFEEPQSDVDDAAEPEPAPLAASARDESSQTLGEPDIIGGRDDEAEPSVSALEEPPALRDPQMQLPIRQARAIFRPGIRIGGTPTSINEEETPPAADAIGWAPDETPAPEPQRPAPAPEPVADAPLLDTAESAPSDNMFGSLFEAEAAVSEEETDEPAPRRRRRRNFLTRKYKVIPDHFWPKSWKRAWRRRMSRDD